MREADIDDVFEQFVAGGPIGVPAGAQAARQLSRRRQRTRVTLTALAVVIAVAVPTVAYGLASRNGTPDIATTPTPVPTTSTAPATPAPTPTAVSTPTPTVTTPQGQLADVPQAALLQQSDVPAGYVYDGDDVNGDWSIEFSGQLCASPTPTASLPYSRVNQGAMFLTGTGVDATSLLERVDRNTLADAQRYMAIIRGLPQTCKPWNSYNPITWQVLREGFAGDESMLIHVDYGDTETMYVLLRVGDLVAQIWFKVTPTEDELVHIGQRAAARLCEGTTAC